MITNTCKLEVSFIDTKFSDLFAMINATTQVKRYATDRITEWKSFSSRYHEENGEYPKLEDIYGFKSIEGLIYHELSKKKTGLSSRSLIATIHSCFLSYKQASKKHSHPNWSDSQPIIMQGKYLNLHHESGNYIVDYPLFSKQYRVEHEITHILRMRLNTKENHHKNILDRILSGEYHLCQSQLKYVKKQNKSHWYFLLAYSHKSEGNPNIDPTKVLGVFMSENVALYASSKGLPMVFKIDGGEIPAFASRQEAIIRSKQRQAACCGDGRIGHGYKTRTKNIYPDKQTLAHFRETINSRYAKALIDFANANGFGEVRLEDLKGIKADRDFPRFLIHWTYFDLQEKIRNAARKCGIKVTIVSSDTIGITCSSCGHIDPKNRDRGVINRFVCTKCNIEKQTDWNASQVLSSIEI